MAHQLIFYMDVIGTVAFAISGAMTAINQGMDIFGVFILALFTATGGGFIRDLTIGVTPPMVFRNPFYMIISFLTAFTVFLIMKWIKSHKDFVSVVTKEKIQLEYNKLLLISDSLGLAAFTADGVVAGHERGGNAFLMIFLGVVTGVGGGVMRDVCATVKPYIFVRHIYAVASLAGAVVTVVLFDVTSNNKAVLIGAGLVLLIRYLAAHYKLNLPRV